MSLERRAAKARNAGKDFVYGPHPLEWLCLLVVDTQEFVDGSLDGTNASVNPALQLLLSEDREETLDLLEPREVRRDEVQAEARVFCEPLCDRFGLMGCEVVENDVDVELWIDRLVDEPQECDELLGSMTTEAFSQDASRRDVDRRK